jgi:hypothetical protein
MLEMVPAPPRTPGIRRCAGTAQSQDWRGCRQHQRAKYYGAHAFQEVADDGEKAAQKATCSISVGAARAAAAFLAHVALGQHAYCQKPNRKRADQVAAQSCED